MSDSPDVNPYAAPQTDVTSAPPDTSGEFVTRPPWILCHGTIQLPPICLHTGHTDDLEPRHQTLLWWNRPFSIASTLSFAILLGAGVGSAGNDEFLLTCVFILCIILHTALEKTILKLLACCPSISITQLRVGWWIQSRYARKHRIMRWTSIGLIVGAGTAVLIQRGSVGPTIPWAESVFAAAAVFLPTCLIPLGGERSLSLAGIRLREPYAGMYQLYGAHQRFLTAAQSRQQTGG